jgi:hypothetical protein
MFGLHLYSDETATDIIRHREAYAYGEQVMAENLALCYRAEQHDTGRTIIIETHPDGFERRILRHEDGYYA